MSDRDTREGETRKVGDRGQVTIPKHLREAFDIQGGDEVTVRAEGDQIVLEKPPTREEIAEGYRRRHSQHAELADEMAAVSSEANDSLGDAPEWDGEDARSTR